MRRLIKNMICIIVITIVMVVFAGLVSVQAAFKPQVREKSVVIYTDATPYTFHFTNLLADSKVKYTSSDKSVLMIKDSQAVPVKAGKATVTINIEQKGKTYILKVKFKVKNAQVKKTYDYKELAKKQNAGLKKNAEKRNYKMNSSDKVIKTTEELDELLADYTKKYISFDIHIKDFDILRSEQEYRDMFPYLNEFKFTNPVIYQDVKIIYVECDKYSVGWLSSGESALKMAVLTGDTGLLTEKGIKYYNRIIDLAGEVKRSTVYDTVKAIYDYIAVNIDYEYDETVEDRHSLLRALDNGKVVCAGYAKLFYFLCMANDINCLLVDGTVIKEAEYNGNLNHAWNLVEIDHKWYSLDPTWDDCYDPEKGYYRTPYKYFLIDDEKMKEDHIWDESKYPKAESKDLAIWYSYLEEYPMMTGKKETLSFLKQMIGDFNASEDKELSLVFNETSYSDDVYCAVLKYIKSLKSKYGIRYKNFKIKKRSNKLGRLYEVTLYK